MSKRTFDDIKDYQSALEAECPPNHAHILERIKADVNQSVAKFSKTYAVCHTLFESKGVAGVAMFDDNLLKVEKNCKKVDPEELRQKGLRLIEIMPTLPDDKELLHAHIQQINALAAQRNEHFELLAVEKFREAEQACQRLIEHRLECAAIRETAMAKARQDFDTWL